MHTKSSRKNFAAAIAMGLLAAQLTFATASFAAQPSPAATRAYNEYLGRAEASMAQDYRPGGALISKELLVPPNAAAQLQAGGVLIQCVAGCASSGVPVPGGLIHDWLGVVFIPGASLPQVLAFVQDYDHAAAHYAPNVTKSRLTARSGDFFRVFLQLKQVEVVTVRFDSDYDVRYTRLDASRVYSISHATHIAQLARGSRDRELPPAENDGFLWRLDSYWRFEQAAGGVYVQCRAISLSRDIPPGLGWVVAPFIKNIPRSSLQFTLSATRAGVLAEPHVPVDKSSRCHPEPARRRGQSEACLPTRQGSLFAGDVSFSHCDDSTGESALASCANPEAQPKGE